MQRLTVTSPHGKKSYPLPDGRDLNEAVTEAMRLHPSWERIKITIAKEAIMPQGGRD